MLLAPSKFSDIIVLALAGINKLLELPRHIVEGIAATEAIAVEPFTVMIALPVLPAAVAAQFASERVAMVYVVVAPGVTTFVIVGAVPLNVLPSDKVPLIIPEPVTAIVNVELFPLHIAVVPFIAPVGFVFMVTEVLPSAPQHPVADCDLK
jgi:hypothetical protein